MKKRFSSYVRFSVIGTECEEFFSDAINNGIKIYDIENIKGVFYAKTAPREYFRLAALKRKYRIRMMITDKKGAVFKTYKYRERYGILLGAVAYGLVVYLCSSIVWDISVTGNERITDEAMLDFLSKNGIYAGISRKDVNTTVTELKALLYFEDLAWISIEGEGSRINVKLNETIHNPYNGLSVSTPCNIVAYKGGRIVEAEIYSGTMLYEIGSGVSEGSVIVSGIVTDGAGNVSVHHADAKIIAEFEEEVSFYKEFVTTERVKTDEYYTEEYIKLFGFTFPERKTKYIDEYIYTSDSYPVNILGITMPWTRTEVRGIKTESVQVTRSVADVKRLLQQELEMYELNFLKKYEIMDKDITYERDEKGIKATCRYTLQGNIASQSEIFFRDEG